jgi:hypothetical protein
MSRVAPEKAMAKDYRRVSDSRSPCVSNVARAGSSRVTGSRFLA